jgi:hypothetical protein
MVHFPIDPAITTEFDECIANWSIGSTIGRGGDIITVVRVGDSLQMHGHIHLTGTCKTNF